MPPLLYPEPPWPVRLGRVVRTLQVVAIAGAIGAVGGGIAMFAVLDGGARPHQPAVTAVGGDSVAKAPGDGHEARQPALPQSDPPAVLAPAPAPPASGSPQPPQLAAAAPEAGEHSGDPAASGIYNRVAPVQRPLHSRSARLRSKDNRRLKGMASRYARERDRGGYDPYGSSDRGEAEGRTAAGTVQRGFYPYYDSSPRTGYWGGGSTFGGGNWGN